VIDLGGIVHEVLGLAGIRATSVSMIELDRSGVDEPLVAVLAFIDDAREPAAFLKLTSDGPAAASLDSEYGNLVRLAEQLPEAMRATVPRPLYRGQVRGLAVLAETVLPGARMKNLSGGWFRSAAFSPALERVMDWLDEFSASDTLAGSRSTSERAGEIVDRYRDRFDRSPEADRLLDEAVASTVDIPLPTVPAHGDFCVENVLVAEGGRIGVIDWEHPLDDGWPLADLLHFIASLWCIPHGKSAATRVENHRRMFYGDHPRRDLFRKRVAGHLRRLGIDPGRAVPLSALAWAQYANRKMQGVPAAADPPDTMPRIFIEDRRCVNLELLALEVGSYLFAGLDDA